jgi:hypothetical protein
MRHWLGIVALTVSLGSACQEDRNVSGRPPAPTDSLYRLYHQLLVDSNPHAVEQAIGCESARITDRFGVKAGLDSIRATRKHAYSWRDRSRLNRVLDGLSGHVFELNEKTCGKFAPARRDSAASETR